MGTIEGPPPPWAVWGFSSSLQFIVTDERNGQIFFNCRAGECLMQPKRVALAGLLLTGVCLLGCNSYLKPPPLPPHAGKVVRVWCPPQLADLVRGHSAAWRERQQAKVETQAEPAGADVWVI